MRRHVFVISLLLRHIAQQPAKVFAQLQNVRPVKQDLPVCPGNVVGQQIHHRTFTCAVCTEDAVDSFGKGDIHAVECGKA